MKKVLWGVVALAMLSFPALGQVVADAKTPAITVVASTPSTTIDLTQIVIASLPFLFAFAIVIVRRGFLRICALLHLQNVGTLLEPLDAIAQQGLALAQSELKTEIAAKGLTIDVKSALVARAGAYVAAQGQAQLASGKLDGAAVAEKLAAMIELNTTPAAVSIAVPTPAPAAPAAAT